MSTTALRQCGNPTATAATDRPAAVGASGAPAVGPFTFHPYPYQPGSATKMIIHVARPEPRPALLRGFRCSDGRVLRFSYDHGIEGLPDPPMTTAQLTAAGTGPTTLAPFPVGSDHTGYALFSGTGSWLITVSVDGTEIGTLAVNVVRG